MPCFTKTILPSGEVVWADGSVGSKPLAKNNTAIDTPRKMIARLVPISRTASCTIPLLSGRHDAALPVHASRMVLVPVGHMRALSNMSARVQKGGSNSVKGVEKMAQYVCPR